MHYLKMRVRKVLSRLQVPHSPYARVRKAMEEVLRTENRFTEKTLPPKALRIPLTMRVRGKKAKKQWMMHAKQIAGQLQRILEQNRTQIINGIIPFPFEAFPNFHRTGAAAKKEKKAERIVSQVSLTIGTVLLINALHEAYVKGFASHGFDFWALGSQILRSTVVLGLWGIGHVQAKKIPRIIGANAALRREHLLLQRLFRKRLFIRKEAPLRLAERVHNQALVNYTETRLNEFIRAAEEEIKVIGLTPTLAQRIRLRIYRPTFFPNGKIFPSANLSHAMDESILQLMGEREAANGNKDYLPKDKIRISEKEALLNLARALEKEAKTNDLLRQFLSMYPYIYVNNDFRLVGTFYTWSLRKSRKRLNSDGILNEDYSNPSKRFWWR